MTVNEAVNDVLFLLNVLWMVAIMIGLVQPSRPKRKRTGTWTQNDTRGK